MGTARTRASGEAGVSGMTDWRAGRRGGTGTSPSGGPTTLVFVLLPCAKPHCSQAATQAAARTSGPSITVDFRESG